MSLLDTLDSQLTGIEFAVGKKMGGSKKLNSKK
jgi:hypothetical protein